MYDILLATKRKMLPSTFLNRSHMWGPSKRRRSELVASDFNLHLYVPEDSGSSRCADLTTGNPECDMHLRRVNRRRRRQCCLESARCKTSEAGEPKPLKDKAYQPPAAAGVQKVPLSDKTEGCAEEELGKPPRGPRGRSGTSRSGGGKRGYGSPSGRGSRGAGRGHRKAQWGRTSTVLPARHP